MRVEGGRFFGVSIMQVDIVDGHTIQIMFDDEEAHFIQRECIDNDITPKEMVEMLFGMLFIGGYSKLVGKE